MFFSQRKGLKDAQKLIQSDSMDQDLRFGLWTALYECVWNKFSGYAGYSDVERSNLELLFKLLWHHYFKFPIDNLDSKAPQVVQRIREYFMNCKWYEVYDVVEFIAQNCPREMQKSLRQFCNDVLDRENSAYRFVDDQLIEISSPAEIESIEDAISACSKLAGVRGHLKSALLLISDRKNPDYRNSIKESISAVESLAMVLTHDANATLGSALKVMESAGAIHPALKKSLSALYGYTSDADGIRHAMLEETVLTSADARFMLVACTAFINYVIAKASQLGLSLDKRS